MNSKSRIGLFCIALAAIVSPALAGNPVHWSFNQITADNGGSASWSSTTAVDSDFPLYQYSFNISMVEGGVNILWMTYWEDATDKIPAEYRSGSGTLDGPCPIVMSSQLIDTPGARANFDMYIDANGFGHIDLTNVWLGEDPSSGITPDKIRITGTMDVLGVIPEPVSFALLGLGAFGFLKRKQ